MKLPPHGHWWPYMPMFVVDFGRKMVCVIATYVSNTHTHLCIYIYLEISNLIYSKLVYSDLLYSNLHESIESNLTCLFVNLEVPKCETLHARDSKATSRREQVQGKGQRYYPIQRGCKHTWYSNLIYFVFLKDAVAIGIYAPVVLMDVGHFESEYTWIFICQSVL